jgi:two-component system sensor kinase FixL
MLRKVKAEVEDVDLNEAIEDTMKLLSQDAKGRGVSLQAELAPNLPKVRADRVQVQQVILNLALNAMEAMHGQPAEHRKVLIRSARANGDEAQVSVADSGIGIAAELLPRIFNPFVTTKPSGMGLGLSISRTIVESHGGRIRAENLPVGGAAFHFTLPFVSAHQA